MSGPACSSDHGQYLHQSESYSHDCSVLTVVSFSAGGVDFFRTQLSRVSNLNSWLVVQNLEITRRRGFFFPEAFRLTLVKGIVRIKNVELRPLIKARREKREVVSDWTKSVDQSKTEALVRDFQRVDKLLLPAQDWLRNFDVSGF